MRLPPSATPKPIGDGPFNRGLVQALRVKATTELPHDWALMFQKQVLTRRGSVHPPTKGGLK